MKSTEPKSTISAANSSTSFFQKRSSQGFFSPAVSGPSFFAPNRGPKTIIQSKLTVGRPNDKYELEADAMADKVVQRLATPEPLSTKEPAVQAKPLASSITPVVQAKCAHCEEEEKLQKKDDVDDEKLELQRKPIFESNAEPPDDDSIQRKCAHCEREEKLQKKSDSEPRAASNEIESSLIASKGSGSPLSSSIREQMESSFGADFSNVRIHTGGSAVQMSKGLHAQAFTHGNDIYFNAGKFDTDSNSGKHLLAHELTHTVQQGGGAPSSQRKIQRWPDWVSDAADWVSDTASDVAGTVVEGAEYVGGQVADGARWVGGKVASGANWVVDQVSAAAQWVIDQIRSVIRSGTNFLNERWEGIKAFGRTCFDDIKNGFGNLVHLVTTPLSNFMTALSMMNADLLGGVWNMLKTGANVLWSGINGVINGVLQIGRGIWNTVSGFIDGIFDTIAGLFDSAAFDLLPDFIKNEARSILNGLRSLWNQISSFWTDLMQRLTSTVTDILTGVQSFVDKIINYGIGSVITMVRNLKEVYDYVTKFFSDPHATIQPLIDKLAEKLNKEVPPGANALGNQLAQQNYPGNAAATADNGSVQRVPTDSEDRSTATLEEVVNGIIYYVARAWAELDIKELLWQTIVNMFWPPATIRAIGNQFSQLWNDHWKTTVDSLYGPRNFFDDPIGCLQDIWSNFLILLDFPLSLWRTLNNVVGLLMGYITILLVLVFAILGGIAAVEVGVVPGLLAGAALGLEIAGAVGEALMVSYILAEGLTVQVVLTRLFTARQLCEKRQVDILTSVASFIAMAVALALQLLMALLAELVSLIANLIKGTPKPVPQPISPPAPKPQPQPLPPPKPQPIPPAPKPQPQPVPVQPVQPVQPAVPGGGQVIPLFPGRRVTPANPGRIAAKFEGGVNEISFRDQFKTNEHLTKDVDNNAVAEYQVAENGILQTQPDSRRSKIDPDACKPRKNICYERSVTFNITRTAMTFIGIQPTPDDLRILGCLLRTGTGTTTRDFKSLNVAIGKFLVKNSFEYIPGVNISGGNIHSEDVILIEANRRWGKGNYKLAALFSERVPCPRCSGNLRGTPLTPDAKIYCIINNDYDWRSIRRSYNDGRLV